MFDIIRHLQAKPFPLDHVNRSSKSILGFFSLSDQPMYPSQFDVKSLRKKLENDLGYKMSWSNFSCVLATSRVQPPRARPHSWPRRHPREHGPGPRGQWSLWPYYRLIQSNPLEILPKVVEMFSFGSRSAPELSSLWSHTFFWMGASVWKCIQVASPFPPFSLANFSPTSQNPQWLILAQQPRFHTASFAIPFRNAF